MTKHIKTIIKNTFSTILSVCTISLCFTSSCNAMQINDTTKTNSDLYKIAVYDSVFAEENEIHHLVTLTKDNNFVTWDESQEHVLLLSWHKYPDSYIKGDTVVFQWGEVWTFTDKEILFWYDTNKNDVTDWSLRLKQLIGLPESSDYTHVTGFWVSPEDVIRPAYVTDPSIQMRTTFPDDINDDDWYAKWFNDNILWSYFDSAYPWTRLGYTYDWADNGKEYGLTEFLIIPNSEALVEFTLTTEEFIDWLDKN